LFPKFSEDRKLF